MGVPIQRVLNDVRNSVDGTPLKRLHIIKKQDIHDIKKDYNINKGFTKRHENDFMSVQLWAQQLAKGSNPNPVLYFKHQGQDDVTTHLGKDDFCIIIMTDFQAEMLVKFGNDKICVDGTHSLNNYSFQLYTLLVVDEYGNRIPVAFCFSNKSDTATYILFFKSVKKLVGII